MARGPRIARGGSSACGLENLGLTHIDTAEMYGSGRAEELTGQAIAGRREEVFLVSKVLPANASYEGVLRACDRSLRRLGTAYLDLYLLHWESSFPIGETMRAIEKLIDDGRIRFTGVSNFDVPQVRAAVAALRHHRLAANQVLYHLKERGIERKLIPYCQEQEIAVVGYTPFGRRAFPRPESAGGRVLAEVAEDCRKNLGGCASETYGIRSSLAVATLHVERCPLQALYYPWSLQTVYRSTVGAFP